MLRFKYLLIIFASVLFFFFGISKITFAYYNNMPASVVIGQENFVSGYAVDNRGGSPAANAFSAHGNNAGVIVIGSKLVISDYENSRILIFNSIPTENNASADVVIGQVDMTSNQSNQGQVNPSANTLSYPEHIATDGEKLFIADANNHRILIYNQLPNVNNASADIVIGQAAMNTRIQVNPPRADTMRYPQGVEYDRASRKLLVSEQTNNRILIFNTVPTANGASADVVLGAPDMNTVGSQTCTSTSLSGARNARVIEGKLFFADVNLHRVMVWNSIPTVNNTPADYVIGQPDLTSCSIYQGTGRVGPNNLWLGLDVAWDGKRFFVATGRRVLIFEGIPTSNNQSAQAVIGQPDLFTNTSYQGAGKISSSTTLAPPVGLLPISNGLVVIDPEYARVLIYNNIISTPQISLKGIETIEYGKKKAIGSVHLGEVGKYTLHNVRISVNGGESRFVTHLDSGIVYDNETVYEWYHEFYPWENFAANDTWNDSLGFTLKVTTSSLNVDDSSIFYFSPFNLNSASFGNVTFSVPKNHVERIKTEVDHFEIWSRENFNSEWVKVNGNIETSVLDSYGVGSVALVTSGEVKVIAVSKTSGWRQDTNSLAARYSGSYINPNNSTKNSFWYPLQVNGVTGITRNILSSFNPSGVAESYLSVTYRPVFSGIAFSGSKVAMRVTNENKPQQFTDYYTDVVGSTWKLTPSLYPKSVINLSVFDNIGRYNQILPVFIDVSTKQ